VCAPKISGERIAKYSYAAARMQWPLAVTLTSPNTPTADGAIRRFRSSLSKFRRTKFWSGTVKGGLVSFEVTNTGKGWHVHAHALLNCRWLALATRAPRRGDSKTTVKGLCQAAHHELSEQWARCLRQPEAVVWVERAWGKALLETVKYAIKPADLLRCKDQVAPIIREMHRLQLVNGFGDCYGLTKEWKAEAKANKLPCNCDKCGQTTDWLPTDVLNMRLRTLRVI
jgi:hypothetical protein